MIASLIWILLGGYSGSAGPIVYFFNVGQGDAAFIRNAAGYNILIDGGPDSLVLKKLGLILPFWERRLDYLILSHPHDDHLLGLIEISRRYQIGQVIRPDYSPSNYQIELFSRLNSGRETKITAPDKIILGPGCYLEFFQPDLAANPNEDLNGISLLSKLSCHGANFLFTGDAGKTQEGKLLEEKADLKATVIKIGHHGSKTASGADFLAAVGAKAAFISVGKDNKYGHPASEILARLEDLGIKIFRTDEPADWRILFNNSQYYIKKLLLD